MKHNMTYLASGPTVKKYFMSNFEARSTLLVAALVLSAASSAHAQTAAPSAASPGSPPSTMSPSATPQAEAATPSTGSTGSTPIPRNKVTAKDLDGIFLQTDTNKDGKLDRKEAESLPAVSQRFEQLDSNHDGFISRVEFGKVAGS